MYVNSSVSWNGLALFSAAGGFRSNLLPLLLDAGLCFGCGFFYEILLRQFLWEALFCNDDIIVPSVF